MERSGLSAGTVVDGLSQSGPATVVAVTWHGDAACTVTYRDSAGGVHERVLYSLDPLTRVDVGTSGRPFDADGADFRLAAEANRIRLAGLFDPMMAVAASDVQPLPHQIRAVYEEMLPRTPLRFLLADDPGAGKTIMAGLYAKELLLRGDLSRCLIVVPGGLVEQWQDELLDKFGLEFDILTSGMVEIEQGRLFDRHPMAIARMDQLARNEDMLGLLRDSAWDLVVVDEAHRMSAHYYGTKVDTTRRYQLGELLGTLTRHLLLMTATPHAGKEDDFQLFLALLDPDRFEGRFRRGIHSSDVSGLMRRMVKEDLLTFEGKPLFPERVAETVPYDLSPLEDELYQEVTRYVREEMNRADRLDPSRRTTVGFALTVLQRRLASSPAAIYRSLVRRRDRLSRRRAEILTAAPSGDNGMSRFRRSDLEGLYDDDELNAGRREEVETELVDAATSAETLAELDAELVVLADLEQLAERVRDSGEDRKWQELRSILVDRAVLADRSGGTRKLIVFTEHRDTLAYLAERIADLLGGEGPVLEIHGGLGRSERRRRTEEFTNNPECLVLVATDAAGEGLNLQRAHLMVNYDLPWNPNRLEQRFGRIHRIGQTEVCRLWNLVAVQTREGEVYARLLAKVEEQRKAYGGKVFDVLGDAFSQRPLRELLMDAVRYGDQPEVRARLDQVINAEVSSGLEELLAERALSHEALAVADLDRLRRRMDEARARRLQPHYVEMFFRHAFVDMRGRISRREAGRFEVTQVPAVLRDGRPRHPIPTRYERVTFDPAFRRLDGRASAQLLTPGHPLVDAVVAETLRRHEDALRRGAILVDPLNSIAEPRLLVAIAEEVVNGLGDAVARRFGYVWVDRELSVTPAGPAPYLDIEPPAEPVDAGRMVDAGWCAAAEDTARSWAIGTDLPEFVRDTADRVVREVARTRAAVESRLSQEANRLFGQAMDAGDKEAAGREVKVRPATLIARAEELERRRDVRLAQLDAQGRLEVKPPTVVGAALVVPASALFPGDGDGSDAPPRHSPPPHAKETREVERRAVDAVLAAERALGREPEEMAHNNPGYDVRSIGDDGHLLHIEVKGRLFGAEDLFVTYNEVLFGKNAAPRYRLALVSVSPDGPQFDEVRYVADPFATTDLGGFASTGIRGDWAKIWSTGRAPF